MIIEFKNRARQEAELEQLKSKNHHLYDLINELSHHIQKKYNKIIVLTEIYRRQEEQERYYGKGTLKKSNHQLWNAVDIRSRDFTSKEIKEIEDYLNTKYNPFNQCKFTALFHEVNGNGEHFHIQFIKKV